MAERTTIFGQAPRRTLRLAVRSTVSHVRSATTKARQGETTGVVRWVLGISLTLVIVGMVAAFLVF
jgi:hypothetical protein